jgi:ribosomal protein S18 acetylase RimI-like enzyme
MSEQEPTESLVIRLAVPQDIDAIEQLDSYSSSPTRNIHRDMEKYFGSVDPSTHDRTLIFLAEIQKQAVGKAELMVPSLETQQPTGYVKRVVIHPEFRGHKLARKLMQYVIDYAHTSCKLAAIDLHVWDGNTAAIKLYEGLGFEMHHREIYFRLKTN